MNRSEIDQVSLQILEQQVPTSLCWITLAPLGIISNLLIVYTIVSSPALKSKSQFVIMSYSISEILNCLAYFGTGLHRYVLYMSQLPATSSQLACVFKQMPLYIFSNAASSFCLALAVDRFLCIAFPIFYQTRSMKRYIYTMNGLIWSSELVRIAMILIDSDRTRLLPICTSVTSFTPWFKQFARYDSPSFVCGTAVLYFATICILWYRYQQVKSAGEAIRSEWRKQIELDIFLAMILVGSIFLLTYGIGASVNAVAGYYNRLEVSLITAPIISTAIILNTISHLFVYLKLNPKFRREFKFHLMKRLKRASRVKPFNQIEMKP